MYVGIVFLKTSQITKIQKGARLHKKFKITS